MIKAIIVDDEEKSRITLQSLIEKHCDSIKICALCDSVESAHVEITAHAPGIVFLDIEMPFQNGFSLLEQINEPDFSVIFVTAYNQHAIRAIKFNAMDYLLKPVNVDELKMAVAKAQKKDKTAPAPDYKALLNMINTKSARIAVPTFEGLQMIDAEEIVKCTAEDSYTNIWLINGKKILVSKLLKEYEDTLGSFNFFRVHNSCLINLAHVSKYIKGDGGYVVMNNGESVEVARRKKTELVTRLALLQI